MTIQTTESRLVWIDARYIWWICIFSSTSFISYWSPEFPSKSEVLLISNKEWPSLQKMMVRLFFKQSFSFRIRGTVSVCGGEGGDGGGGFNFNLMSGSPAWIPIHLVFSIIRKRTFFPLKADTLCAHQLHHGQWLPNILAEKSSRIAMV